MLDFRVHLPETCRIVRAIESSQWNTSDNDRLGDRFTFLGKTSDYLNFSIFFRDSIRKEHNCVTIDGELSISLASSLGTSTLPKAKTHLSSSRSSIFQSLTDSPLPFRSHQHQQLGWSSAIHSRRSLPQNTLIFLFFRKCKRKSFGSKTTLTEKQISKMKGNIYLLTCAFAIYCSLTSSLGEAKRIKVSTWSVCRQIGDNVEDVKNLMRPF